MDNPQPATPPKSNVVTTKQVIALIIMTISLLAVIVKMAMEMDNENTSESSSGITVSSDQFGDAWPLTVRSGVVDCLDSFSAVFRHGGTIYQLNGIASSRGYTKINPIWRDHPNPLITGSKVNIGPLISLALEQC